MWCPVFIQYIQYYTIYKTSPYNRGLKLSHDISWLFSTSWNRAWPVCETSGPRAESLTPLPYNIALRSKTQSFRANLWGWPQEAESPQHHVPNSNSQRWARNIWAIEPKVPKRFKNKDQWSHIPFVSLQQVVIYQGENDWQCTKMRLQPRLR